MTLLEPAIYDANVDDLVVPEPPPRRSPPRRFTVEEFLALPYCEDYELEDGLLVERTMSYLSSRSAVKISTLLSIWGEKTGAGEVLDSELMYRFPGTDARVRRADVSFFRAGRITPELRESRVVTVPPDLAVEVPSPTDNAYALDRKIAHYLRSGVRLVWAANPEARTVRVIPAAGDRRELTDAEDIDGGDVLPGFKCKVADFFPPPVAAAP